MNLIADNNLCYSYACTKCLASHYRRLHNTYEFDPVLDALISSYIEIVYVSSIFP